MEKMQELMDAYRAMSPWARGLILDVAKDYAAKFPAPKIRASLALVPCDGINIQAAAYLLDNGVDRRAPVTVCKSVDGKKS